MSTSPSIPGDENDTVTDGNIVPLPVNWDAAWKHLVLLRKSTSPDGEEHTRRPLVSRPENTTYPAGSAARRFSEVYWQGLTQTWEEWAAIVDGSNPFPIKPWTPKDIGFVPSLNEMVVIDCDVKEYFDAPDGSCWVATDGNKNRFTFADTYVKKGIDDLARLCVDLGHHIDELATYTVLTKSGGFHLYFHQNCEYPLQHTTHHRSDWRNDVIVSENNWVAAPPTPGYRVVRDYPVATLPDWMAESLMSINDRYGPVGGSRHTRVDKHVNKLRNDIARSVSPWQKNGATEDGTHSQYIAALLQTVRMSNQDGMWNKTIYQVTKDLARLGLDYATIESMVLSAALPDNEREKRNATRTIASGWSNVRKGR